MRGGFELQTSADIDLSLHSVLSLTALDAADNLLREMQSWTTAASTELAGQILEDVGIPIVSTALTVVGLFVSAFKASAAAKAEAQRAYGAMEGTMRPIGTGLGGQVMPCDILGSYLLSEVPTGRYWRVPGVKGTGDIPYKKKWGLSGPQNPSCFRGPNLEKGPERVKLCLGLWTKDGGGGEHREALMPALGCALWVRGSGRALAYPHREAWPPHISRLTRSQATVVRADFERLATEIGAQRGVRGTNGGALLWPVLLDTVRAAKMSEAWAKKLAEDNLGTRYPASHAAVSELLRRWDLTRDPIYEQDQAELEKLRKEIWKRSQMKDTRIAAAIAKATERRSLFARFKAWLAGTLRTRQSLAPVWAFARKNVQS